MPRIFGAFYLYSNKSYLPTVCTICLIFIVLKILCQLTTMRNLYVVLTIVLLGVVACKKKSTAPTADETPPNVTSAIWINNINDSVYLTLNGHDIATGTIPHIISITLPPNDTMIVPPTDLKDAYRYQYNWHTANYKYSNWWAVDANGNAVEELFDYYGDTTDFAFTLTSEQREELLRCFDGDGIYSTWQATNAFNNAGTSVWSFLPDNDKQHEFIISRFHTVKHIFIDTNSAQTTTNLSFALDLSQARTKFDINHMQDRYTLSNNLQGIAPVSTNKIDELYYVPFTIDSATQKRVYQEPYYLLKRVSIEK